MIFHQTLRLRGPSYSQKNIRCHVPRRNRPCSMKTLASVAHGFGDNLISRAADVTLKERRRLLLMPRETPLNLAHIRNMAAVTEMGGIIFPPMPAFYGKSKTLDDLVNEAVGRMLELFGIEPEGLYEPWTGLT